MVSFRIFFVDNNKRPLGSFELYPEIFLFLFLFDLFITVALFVLAARALTQSIH